jgi:hypothetical protein
MDERVTVIRRDLDERIAKNEVHMRTNRCWTSVCTVVAVLAGLTPALLTALDLASKSVLALVSAVAAAAIALNKSFKFDRRAQWHHDKVSYLSKFRSRLDNRQHTEQELDALKKEIDDSDTMLMKRHPESSSSR